MIERILCFFLRHKWSAWSRPSRYCEFRWCARCGKAENKDL